MLALALAPPVRGALPAPLADALRREGVSAGAVSLFVQAVDAPRPLLVHLPDRPRNPASTMKLVTTFAALDRLGPAYRWKTEYWAARAPDPQGTLPGDLYLKGYGDPYLLNEYFWRQLRDLRHRGLRRINGDLVIDDSHFAPEPEDPAAFDGRPHRAYNLAPGALLLNFQAVELRFLPRDDGVRVIADPHPEGLRIVNRLRPAAGPCRGWRGVGLRIQARGEAAVVRLAGRYRRDCGARGLYRVVSGLRPYVLAVFRELWRGLGGAFDGSARRGRVPEGAVLLHRGESRPLAEILRAINKYSNNVMARQLLLTLAAEVLGPPATTAKGRQVLRAWLAEHGLLAPGTVIDNGAGRSRRGRLTARQLGGLLLRAYRHPYMAEFVSSLALTGTDGTLQKRHNGHALAGRGHIKTGLLDDVRALAGYLTAAGGRRYVVVLLDNHRGAHGPGGERIQDALLDWVHRRP